MTKAASLWPQPGEGQGEGGCQGRHSRLPARVTPGRLLLRQSVVHVHGRAEGNKLHKESQAWVQIPALPCQTWVKRFTSVAFGLHLYKMGMILPCASYYCFKNQMKQGT